MESLKKSSYHPVIQLPTNYEIFDFTKGYDSNRVLNIQYGIGRFNENRKGMYTSALFTKGEARTIHMGIDIAAPINTPIYAFADGEIFLFGYNAQDGDYGYTLITKHLIDSTNLYVLHGHLSKKSVEGKAIGSSFKKGAVLAWIGDKSENGGWNPHLHFQVSLEEPKVCDMPGAVSESQLESALKIYLDPRILLGPLY